VGIHVNDGGTFKRANQVYVNDGGTWKEPHEIYIRDAGTWKLVHKLFTISSNQTNYNLYTALGSPTVPLTIRVTINAITIKATNTSSNAFTVGNFPAGTEVYIINNGTLLGAGAQGGRGTDYNNNNGTAGGTGGTALYTRIATKIQNNNTIAGGGGGGGGGGWRRYSVSSGKTSITETLPGSGGGGGAGDTPGAGGAGGAGGSTASVAGAAGSSTAGGAGGVKNQSVGGNGGGRGANGAAGSGGSNPTGGGLSGFYINGNSYVTWITNGTRQGRTTG